MKIEVVGYVPPRGIGHPEAYLANIGAFKTEFPVSLFSDYPDWGLRQSDNPGKVKHRQFGHWVSNYAFFMALQYSVACKLDYFIYLEEDCRVRGDGWDGRMMQEAYEQNPAFAAAGSTVCYNPSGSGHETLKLVTDYAHRFLEYTGLAMPIYGFRPGLTLYPNGAGAIYRTEIVERIFRGFHNDLARASQVSEAWDLTIGRELFAMYGNEVFNLVLPLSCSYSGCTDDLISWPQRQQMLESGEKCLIHQCKTDYR